MGRTTKIFNYIIPQKPATYKGFRGGGYRIATRISSAARYDHFDTLPCLLVYYYLTDNISILSYISDFRKVNNNFFCSFIFPQRESMKTLTQGKHWLR